MEASFVRSASWIGRLTVLGATVLLVVGCSSSKKLVPVTGTVMVKGKPAAGALVLFHADSAEGGTASGVASSDGVYALVSGLNKGVAPGKYRVTVVWPDQSKKPTEKQIMMGTAEDGPDLLNGKYASPERSGLTMEVSGNDTQLPPLELD